jgi:hypothetical protein
MADKTKTDYKCDWCGNKFARMVATSSGGKHNNVSTQVQCDRCHNFLSTWGDKK